MTAARVVFHNHAYTTLMDKARAAMPRETVGLLTGSVQHEPTGQALITVMEAQPLGLGTTGDRLVPGPHIIDEARQQIAGHDAQLEVVGWFYADPGIGTFQPRLSIEDMQSALPSKATLLLLVNPFTDQGAFYSWNGLQFIPTEASCKAVPDKSLARVMTWGGQVHGANVWLGALLAALPAHDAAEEQRSVATTTVAQPNKASYSPGTITEEIPLPIENEPNEQDTPESAIPAEEDSDPLADSEDKPLLAADEHNPDYAVPIFVEVITEEPVEYLAPERPIATGDLDPAVADAPTDRGSDTLPYPIFAEPDEDDEPFPVNEPWNTVPFKRGLLTSPDADVDAANDPAENQQTETAQPTGLHDSGNAPPNSAPETDASDTVDDTGDANSSVEALPEPAAEPEQAIQTGNYGTGPLGPEPELDPLTAAGPVTGEFATIEPGEPEANGNMVPASRSLVTTILTPPAHSDIQPVLRRKSGKEAVLAVGLFLALAFIGAMALAGALPKQTAAPAAGTTPTLPSLLEQQTPSGLFSNQPTVPAPPATGQPEVAPEAEPTDPSATPTAQSFAPYGLRARHSTDPSWSGQTGGSHDRR